MLFPLLQIKNLRIDFVTESEVVTAVNNVNISIDRNEIVGIAGESGSGKSVTSLAVLQLLPGRIARYVDGEILFSPDGLRQVNMIGMEEQMLRSIRGKEIAMIFQEPMSSLNPVYTCGDQVMEAIRLHQRMPAEEAKRKTIDLFAKVKLPSPAEIFYRYPHQLSGGQKQRVMIAMAMSCNPSLLICDEPTTALDVTVQKTVLELIRDLQQETGMGVIFITHDLGVIAEIANRVIVMYKGTAVEEGNVNRVFTSPSHPYTRGLLACRPALYAKGKRLPVVSDFLDESAAPAHAAEVMDEKRYDVRRETLINVDQLSVHFPARTNFLGKPLAVTKAVDNVSFEVYKGETLGLVGESGCGKTTLGRTILRLVEPASGNIFYEGTNIRKLSGKQLKSFRKNIQIIFQDPYSSLNPSLTVGSMIGEPLEVHQSQLSYSQRRHKVIALMEKVGLKADQYGRYPHEFSGGQRQRIVIARALILEPSFIVCDESVSALDVSIQAQVLNLLNDLRREFGFTSIFISHDLSVIRYVSDRIMVMNKGRIVESGPANQVYLAPRSSYTKTLLEAVPGAKAG